MSRPGWRARLHRLRREALTVYHLARDPALPWPPRLLALLVAAYAFSPVDLIPDAIPVLGLLDDLLLIPLGLALVLRLSPPARIAAARERAERSLQTPVSRLGLALVLTAWLLAGLLLVRGLA
ncbi:MAG TPA: DUF1232 domain-containing protein [Nevskiaceae bacterium]|nr:DUF1232 domain-containing protein [Nevskiaceae bacterium]